MFDLRKRLRPALICVFMCLYPAFAAAQTVKLAWDPSGGGVGYMLRWGQSPGVYTDSADAGAATSIDLTGLTPGKTYWAVVEAYDLLGQFSRPSDPLQFAVPADPAVFRERARSDMNGDGSYDLLWRNAGTGQLAAWMLNGANVKVEAGVSQSMPDLNWKVVGTGDFNGDGKPDIAWHHRLYGFIAVWFMDGTTCVGVASLSVPQVADIGWKIVTVTDFNRDGSADVLWQHDTGVLVLWMMNGIKVVASPVINGDAATVGDPRWRVAAAADMNGDGQVDLLWKHPDGWIATWLMNGTSVEQVWSLNPVAEFDPALKIVGTLDVNRDGKQDIVWQHDTGSVTVWVMDGITRVQTLSIGGGSLTGTNWKVVGPK